MQKKYKIFLGVAIVITLLLFVSIFFFLSEASLNHLKFTEQEIDQMKIYEFGNTTYFSVPNKEWLIRIDIPEYYLAFNDFSIFQATKHYTEIENSPMVTILTSIIDPSMNVASLEDCIEYVQSVQKKDSSLSMEEDYAVLKMEFSNMEINTILNYYDGYCIDTMINTQGLTEFTHSETEKIINSFRIVSENEFIEVVEEYNKANSFDVSNANLFIEGEDWYSEVNLSGLEEGLSSIG